MIVRYRKRIDDKLIFLWSRKGFTTFNNGKYLIGNLSSKKGAKTYLAVFEVSEEGVEKKFVLNWLTKEKPYELNTQLSLLCENQLEYLFLVFSNGNGKDGFPVVYNSADNTLRVIQRKRFHTQLSYPFCVQNAGFELIILDSLCSLTKISISK